MKIFFNGDSHTSGSELYYPTQDTFSYRLAKLLNADEVINLAIGGASNDRILRTTEEYLRECKNSNDYPDLIVIGWSECCRTDWFVNGQYYSIFSQELTPEETYKVDAERAKYYIDFWRQPENRNIMAKYYNDRIYDLHKQLEFLNIPHLFFMGVCSFEFELRSTNFPQPNEYNNFMIHYDWGNSFWKPYDIDGSFVAWGKENGYEITPFFHLKEPAHEAFAQILYEHIKNNRLLES